MIYIDPPYGIKYGSNFQPFTNRRDVKDRNDDDLTQEPETLKAFRDTWELGVHSYLTYLRDRLLLSRELLCSTGSIFVQIWIREPPPRPRDHGRCVRGRQFSCSVIAMKAGRGRHLQSLPPRRVCGFFAPKSLALHGSPSASTRRIQFAAVDEGATDSPVSARSVDGVGTMIPLPRSF